MTNGDPFLSNLSTEQLEKMLRDGQLNAQQRGQVEGELSRRYAGEFLDGDRARPSQDLNRQAPTWQPAPRPPAVPGPSRRPLPPPQPARAEAPGRSANAGCISAIIIGLVVGVVAYLLTDDEPKPRATNTCFTSVGKCPMADAAPLGTSCYCAQFPQYPGYVG